MPHRYFNPVSIHLGAGSVAQLPAILGTRRAVLVTFPEARALGLAARLESILGASHAATMLWRESPASVMAGPVRNPSLVATITSRRRAPSALPSISSD